MVESDARSRSVVSGASLAIVVGAGETGHRVARSLGRGNWHIRLIDAYSQRDAHGETPDDATMPNVEVIQGDGTSRLVLERAGAADASAFVAATGDDDTNVEVARLAREAFGIRRVLALCRSPLARKNLETMGAEPIDVPSAVGSIVVGRLEPTMRPAVGVGLSQGEIVEVTLLGSSPVVGRPLRSLGAREWLVAAVYRDESLLVPHGDTTLEAGDRVVLVGAPSAVTGIAEYFRAGRSVFPLPYGRRLGVVAFGVLTKVFWAEVEYLRQTFNVAGVDVFAEESIGNEFGHSCHVLPRQSLLEAALDHPGIGCLVLPPERDTRLSAIRVRRSKTWSALARTRTPVIVARGTFPYRRLALAALEPETTHGAAEVAVGMAGLLGAALSGITATPPAFVVGHRAVAEQMDALSETAVIAQVQRVPLAEHHLFGNPVRRISEHANTAADLLVVGHQPLSPWSFWKVDVAGELVLGTRCSTLAVPAVND